MTPPTYPCPVTGCKGRRHSIFLVMCGRCWRAVPKDLQRRVYAAWDARRRDPDDDATVRAHQEVRDQAIGTAEQALKSSKGARP